MTYGPMSDGVSDIGGGRLIKVGVDMVAGLGKGKRLEEGLGQINQSRKITES